MNDKSLIHRYLVIARSKYTQEYKSIKQVLFTLVSKVYL